MAENEPIELVDAADPERGIVAFLRAAQDLGPPGTPTDQKCEFCQAPIVVGQHYVRLAVMFATAGMETLIDTPEVAWSGIFDTPSCAGIALAKASLKNPLFIDVFGR